MTERTSSRAFLRMAVLACLVAFDTARAQCLGWTSGFGAPGMDATVRAYAVFDDGSGPALYAGGEFVTADDSVVNHVAKWDGNQWSAVGSGMNGTVNALIVFDDGSGPALYAGGPFSTAGGVTVNSIAKWDGANWAALASGAGFTPFALTVWDDGSGPVLVAAGITVIGPTPGRVAKWNGSTWTAFGGFSGSVNALAVYDDGSGPTLVAGGFFSVSGSRLARWTGSTWSPVGAPTDDAVESLAVFDDGSGTALFVGGRFTTAGAVSANHIAKWDSLGWSAVGSGLGGAIVTVLALTVFDNGAGSALYAGGTAGFVSKWDGASWTSVGDFSNGPVYTLIAFDGGDGFTLHAGGGFSFANPPMNSPVFRTASWNGSTWRALGGGKGLLRPTFALATFDDGSGSALYAGGSFSGGGDSEKPVSRWAGGSWSAVGAGFFEPFGSLVSSLVVFDDGNGPALYAAGTFDQASLTTVNNIARWNGAIWKPLDAGIVNFVGQSANPSVYTTAVFDDGSGPALYAGGDFDVASGAVVNNIARWDGAAWTALGSGISPRVRALAVYDDGSGPALFVGGLLSAPGGTHAIAKWDGATWLSVGGGLSSSTAEVNSLCVFDDGSGPALYATGDFTGAGGGTAANIARWNGSAWSALGSGLQNSGFALGTFNDGSGIALYAGGRFTMAGGVGANRIAKWNGSTWSALHGGVSGTVNVLADFDDGSDGVSDLYVGGSFSKADGRPSQNIARWRGCEPGVAYCLGDGLGSVVTAACPCSNFGASGHGCGNSSFASGGRLTASGKKSPNTIVFTLTNVPNNALATGFRTTTNTNPGGVVFGDGVRCQSGTLIRFGAHNTGTLGDAPQTWTAAPDTVASGLTRYYQIQYRNPAPAFCPPGTFNVSNGYRITW